MTLDNPWSIVEHNRKPWRKVIEWMRPTKEENQLMAPNPEMMEAKGEHYALPRHYEDCSHLGSQGNFEKRALPTAATSIEGPD